ncbi:MAG: peptidylprolyl isomerase [Armatimonas sp.]
MKKVLISLLCIICIGSLGANAYLYQKYSTRRPILTIKGGDTVTLKEFRDQLEFQHGRETLRKLTMSKIVSGEARKAGVYPPDKAVEERIKEIERTSPDAIPAGRREELKKELFVEMALEGLSLRGVEVTDDEARAFLAKHPELFHLPRQAKVTLVVADDEIHANTAERMLNRKEVHEAELAMEPGLRVAGLDGFQPNLNLLPEADREKLRTTALNLKAGAVARLKLQNTHFVLRAEIQESAQQPTYDAVREKARRLARLSKARPRDVVLSELYKNAEVNFEMDYRDWFSDLRNSAVQAASTK